MDINKNVILAHIKEHLKKALGIIKGYLTTLNTKITELPKEFWEIKNHNAPPNITRKIIRICRAYNPNSKRCLLCLNEKYGIATYKEDNLSNKRTELINTCRHISRYKLVNCKSIDWCQFHVPLQYLVLNCSVILCKLI